MRTMEESEEFSLCGGEGMHICVACPKHMFVKAICSNMPLHIPDTALPTHEKKTKPKTLLKLIM